MILTKATNLRCPANTIWNNPNKGDIYAHNDAAQFMRVT